MKFEDLLQKPIEDMSDEEIAKLIEKLDVPEIGRLEKAVFNKLGRKKKKGDSKKAKENLDMFDKIVGVKNNVSE